MNERSRQVSKAQRVFRQGGDTRAMKREIEAGNPYVVAKLDKLGLEYRNGAIRRKS